MLVEVKALFAKSLAKIQFSPEVLNDKQQKHLRPVTKTREVLIPTPNKVGDGDDFAHPAKFDYANPITAIFMKPNSLFNFETQDRSFGVN